MRAIILAALVLLSLPAVAQRTLGAIAPGSELPANVGGPVSINKPAASNDGYAGGLSVTRDTSNVYGGVNGHVNTAAFFRCTVGNRISAFEWCALSLVDSYATMGEHVASYNQANKRGPAGIWAGVDEATDADGLPGALVGREIDVWATGRDTGSRVNLDLAVGDARTIRNLPGGGVAEATAAMRTGASTTTPWARWTNAVHLSAFLENGLIVGAADERAKRAIVVNGSYVVGLDLSGAKTSGSAIRLGAGQRMTFEATDQVRWGYVPGGVGSLAIEWGGRTVFRVDAAGNLFITGDVYRNGVRALAP